MLVPGGVWPGQATEWQCQDSGHARSRDRGWDTLMRHHHVTLSPGYLPLIRRQRYLIQVILHWQGTFLLSTEVSDCSYFLENFENIHYCVSNMRNLSIASIYVTVSVRHEAAQAGLAWGQLQLWILSQVRVTLSPHNSLTWPHHWSLKHCQSWWFRRTLFTFIHYLCTPQNVLFFCFF